eukprot:TRINITY_DN810_c0_g1_i17.p1 TRINITY_DN810_c0_g1~~TRINITY_DN810_c0_g1_i17.p1  ORF type:complete len:134 (+),score=23.13 TRINITY_DN810_c0_g1_i17:97-498(+)
MQLVVFALSLLAIVVQSAYVPLTLSNNNTIIEVQLEDKIDVILPGRPSTGYVWTNFALEGNAILQDGEPYFVSNSSLHGGPGIYHFPYVANEVGTSSLTLVEARSWESAPINIFSVLFNASPNKGASSIPKID